MPEKVSLSAVMKRLAHAYEPEPVARVDDHQALVVRYEGKYPKHSHDADEFLLCIQGEITVELPDATVTLRPNEALRIPAGTLHSPSGKGGIGLLFESASLATRLPGTTD